MTKTFRSIFLALLLCPLYAHAWLSVAHSTSSGHTQLFSNAVSKEEARAESLKTCNTKTSSTDCQSLVTCNGPTALVIFRGDGGESAVCNTDPQLAYKKAKENCSKQYENCRPLTDLITWDEGTSLMVLAYNKDNDIKMFDVFLRDYDVASAEILKTCKQKFGDSECHHTSYISKKWWEADAFDTQDKPIGLGISSNSKKEAVSYAQNQCLKNGVNIENCKIKHYEQPENPAPKSFADIIKVAKKDLAAYSNKTNTPKSNKVVANNVSCRPNTANIRCQSNCVNGNCVVTYENGCKMTVQIQPKLNPFTNQFEFPSPSC